VRAKAKYWQFQSALAKYTFYLFFSIFLSINSKHQMAFCQMPKLNIISFVFFVKESLQGKLPFKASGIYIIRTPQVESQRSSARV